MSTPRRCSTRARRSSPAMGSLPSRTTLSTACGKDRPAWSPPAIRPSVSASWPLNLLSRRECRNLQVEPRTDDPEHEGQQQPSLGPLKTKADEGGPHGDARVQQQPLGGRQRGTRACEPLGDARLEIRRHHLVGERDGRAPEVSATAGLALTRALLRRRSRRRGDCRRTTCWGRR